MTQILGSIHVEHSHPTSRTKPRPETTRNDPSESFGFIAEHRTAPFSPFSRLTARVVVESVGPLRPALIGLPPGLVVRDSCGVRRVGRGQRPERPVQSSVECVLGNLCLVDEAICLFLKILF